MTTPNTATIYTPDGAIISEGLQTADVCDQAIRAARSAAADRDGAVVLVDSDGVWLVRPGGSATPISREAWESGDGVVEPLAIDTTIERYGEAYDDKVDLILDPEGDVPHVYTFGRIGSGVPMPVYHRRHLTLGHIPREVVPESLDAWLQARTEEVVALASRYQGTEWDGHNQVGRWGGSCDPGDTVPDYQDWFEAELGQAFTHGEIATYWAAGDYFAADPNAVIETVILRGDIGNAAADEVEAAAEQGAHLDHEDAVEALCELLRSRLEDLEDSKDPDERLERLRIHRLLAKEEAA